MLKFHSHVALYQTCDFHCVLCINTLSLEYVVPIGMTYLNGEYWKKNEITLKSVDLFS